MRVLLYFLLITTAVFAQSQSLEAVRKSFHEAVKDPQKSKEFYDYIKEHPGTDPVIMAYKAVSKAMVAQAIWNPLAKYSHVKRFNKEINEIVSTHQNHLEIRFLRFAVEYYLPRFLMMSDHLDEDRDFLITNLSSIEGLGIDNDFAKYIIYFMNETGMVAMDEMEEIKASLAPGPDHQF